jgi:excinuclease UvrABC nuclease subunit
VKVSDIRPPVEQYAAFELYALDRIVDSSACYCLTNAEGDILYVGQALSVRQRLMQHFDSEKRTALTVNGRASLAWWRAESAVKLDALERGWIEAVRLRDGQLPPLNRISGRT